ncbi:hypothetical protein HYV74_01445 [Candidatus Uhrbacteria bacterium]|nr:hypothetical protein [Candidatus Uhrbacteria bacterium]
MGLEYELRHFLERIIEKLDNGIERHRAHRDALEVLTRRSEHEKERVDAAIYRLDQLLERVDTLTHTINRIEERTKHIDHQVTKS